MSTKDTASAPRSQELVCKPAAKYHPCDPRNNFARNVQLTFDGGKPAPCEVHNILGFTVVSLWSLGSQSYSIKGIRDSCMDSLWGSCPVYVSLKSPQTAIPQQRQRHHALDWSSRVPQTMTRKMEYHEPSRKIISSITQASSSDPRHALPA